LAGLIPPFNEHGYLPPGIHQATLDEVIDRFGTGSEQREAQAQSLLWLLPLCRDAAIAKLLINGSFVTDVQEPNDVDCVLLAPVNFDRSAPPVQRLLSGLPFLEIRVVNEDDYLWYASVLYASDRAMIDKGVVEVVL
jgi:hypothetical protein